MVTVQEEVLSNRKRRTVLVRFSRLGTRLKIPPSLKQITVSVEKRWSPMYVTDSLGAVNDSNI